MKYFSYFVIKKAKILINYFLLFLFLPISIILLFAIRLISPLIIIRFRKLVSTRIGHYACDTEIYLCEKDFKINTPKKKYLDIFYNVPNICNNQLNKMWKRVIIILPWHLMESIDYINMRIPGGLKHQIGKNTAGSKDVHNLLDRTKPHIAFTQDEEKYGQALLQNMGIKKNDKFVCLLVRDSSYLDSLLHKKNYYHNYRDCDVKNFEMACKYLASKGIFVIRMGAKVKNKLNYSNEKIIDYATNGMRNEFMDIYIGAKCYFWITTDTGLDNVAKLFRKPGVYTNCSPLSHINTSVSNFIVLIKHYYDLNKKKKMSINEIREKKLTEALSTIDFDKQSVTLIENSPEEILEAVEEMVNRLSGTWKESPSYSDNQLKFWKSYPYDPKIHAKKITSKIGSKFLERNKYLLD